MFLKISKNSKDASLDTRTIILNLNNYEEIIDIEVIDEGKLLITISDSNNIKGLIYNIKQNKILQIIEK